ncbi:MAG: ABC transporter permease subunit [Planctomycetota bacterium]|nr:ABC transporter permease subunit [Planctomycetota bacterium]
MSRDRRGPPATLTIFSKELRELLRDRRAVFFAFVLPLLLYPVLFFGLTALPGVYQEDLEEKELRVGVARDLSGFLEHVTPDDHLDVSVGVFDPDAVRDGDPLAFLARRPPDDREDDRETGDGSSPSLRPTEEPLQIRAHYLEASAASTQAFRRIRRVVERWNRREVEKRFSRRGVSVSVDDLVRLKEVDVSTATERGAAKLGLLLPLILVVLLLTGGSFAAIDLVAGEKERGTLETLCVQPVSRGEIAFGKFLVILVTSLASVFLNLAGLLLSFALGVAPEGLDAESLLRLPAANLLLVLLLTLPLAVLSSSVLLGLSAYARSYREAQTYLLPVTLVALLPVALAASPDVTLSSVVALVPVGNVAVALREVLAGRAALLPLLAVFLSSGLYACVALRKSTALLGREDLVLGLESPALAGDALAESRERRALAFGAVTLLLVYYAAPWLQSGVHFSITVGLALTLWVVVLAPALIFPLLSRQPMRRALALRAPRARDAILAPFLATAAAILAAGYMELQEGFLPMPEELGRVAERIAGEFEAAGVVVAFLLLAVSPGVAEELLWRGAFQGELEPRGRPLRVVVLVGLFFGLFHLSVYRFVPTALAGMALAAIRLRSRSIVPCMIFHIAFNAVTLFVLGPYLEGEGGRRHVLDQPVLVVAALVVLVAGFRLLGKGPRRTGESTGSAASSEAAEAPESSEMAGSAE